MGGVAVTPREVAAALVDGKAGHGSDFYCVNGHSNVYRKTDADRERERAEVAERRLAAERDTAHRWRRNAERAERSARAYKGHLTRMRNRISNGVCPVPGCKRSGFTQVMRHLASQHPDWLAEHQHEIDG